MQQKGQCVISECNPQEALPISDCSHTVGAFSFLQTCHHIQASLLANEKQHVAELSRLRSRHSMLDCALVTDILFLLFLISCNLLFCYLSGALSFIVHTFTLSVYVQI